jgi:endoglucanase
LEGLIIRRIDDHGWLWFEAVGGVRPQQLFGKHVIIKTETGYVDGLVNSIKPGRPESCTDIPPVSDFFIEVGAATKQDALDMGIEVGNPVSIDYPAIFLGKNKEMVAGKALDDRACVFMLIELLKLLKDDENIPDIYCVFSSQEEVGCRGAKVAAHNIKPDIAISLDISIASDIPNMPDRKVITKIGDGTAIKVMDKISTSQVGVICSQEIVSGMKKTAQKQGIKYQLEVHTSGGTDIDTMQTENGGMLTGGILVPTRYVHSYEMCSVEEIVDSVELLYNYIKTLA